MFNKSQVIDEHAQSQQNYSRWSCNRFVLGQLLAFLVCDKDILKGSSDLLAMSVNLKGNDTMRDCKFSMPRDERGTRGNLS